MRFPLQLKKDVQSLVPAYFALVMATGIIGIAAKTMGFETIAGIFFYLNNVEFTVLFILYLLRFLIYFQDFKSDLISDEKGVGFLTIVAGSGVLGVQYIVMWQEYFFSSVLWYFSIAVWIIFMFLFFMFTTSKEVKPSLDEGINGIWLLLIVSTQSIAILGNELVVYLSRPVEPLMFFTFSFFLLGIALYLMLITLIFYRLVFFSIRTKEILHPYWINTGAAAISTLSGTILVEKISQTHSFIEYLPFVKGFTVLIWITGTWWIPIIIVMELWHYVLKRIPWVYDPRQWSMVFAIGMYSIASWRLSLMVNISYLKPYAEIFFFLALFLWILTFLSMMRRLLKSFFKTKTNL